MFTWAYSSGSGSHRAKQSEVTRCCDADELADQNLRKLQEAKCGIQLPLVIKKKAVGSYLMPAIALFKCGIRGPKASSKLFPCKLIKQKLAKLLTVEHEPF